MAAFIEEINYAKVIIPVTQERTLSQMIPIKYSSSLLFYNFYY